jgi:ATP-dependent DNA ligase
VAAIMALPVRSCLIDGEAIVSDEAGLAVFELIRSFRHDAAAALDSSISATRRDAIR